MGGALVVEGDVVGSLNSTAGTIRVNAKIGGDILATASESLTFGDNAEVIGNVTYTSPQDAVRAQDAQITGDINRFDFMTEGGQDALRTIAFQVSVLLFTVCTFYLLGRKYLHEIVERATHHTGMSGLVGIGVLLVIPFVSAILLVSVVGSIVGVALLLIYFLLMIASFACAAVLLGYIVQKMLTGKTGIKIQTVGMGVVLLMLVSLVPGIGGFLVFAAVLISLGALSLALYKTII